MLFLVPTASPRLSKAVPIPRLGKGAKVTRGVCGTLSEPAPLPPVADLPLPVLSVVGLHPPSGDPPPRLAFARDQRESGSPPSGLSAAVSNSPGWEGPPPGAKSGVPCVWCPQGGYAKVVGALLARSLPLALLCPAPLALSGGPLVENVFCNVREC